VQSMSGSTAVINQAPQIRTLLSAFDKLADPSVSDFTSSIPERFEEAALHVSSQNLLVSDFVLRNRMMMKPMIEKFHGNAGTLTASVQESIQLLDDPTTKIVVSTHQPNLFAYGGVFKKIVMLENIRNLSAPVGHSKIINLFLIVDHDFVDETWMRVAQLPSINHSSGIMELRAPITDSKRWLMVCNVPLPSKGLVNNWKHQVKSWIRNCSESQPQIRNKSNAHFEEFWQQIVETSYSRAKSYSDLNSFITSHLVNHAWGYSTLFVRLSDLAQVFENGFTFLLSNFALYSDALRGIEQKLMSRGIDTGVSSSAYQNAPVWIHCSCGSKASAKLLRDETTANLAGTCTSCKKHLELSLGKQDDLDISKVVKDMSPRAIPIPLLLSRDLGISCYASGTGGIGYLLDGSVVAKKMSLNFPYIAIWSSKDKYLGIGQLPASSEEYPRDESIDNQLETLQKRSEICREKMAPLLSSRRNCIAKSSSLHEVLSEIFSLKEEQRHIHQQINFLSRARNIENLAPCFIDYVANFGMKETERLWTEHLAHDGRLAAPVIFR
jgi:hypothetical protein